MKLLKSFRVGTLFGIPVDLHPSLLLIIGMFAVVNQAVGLPWYLVAVLGILKACIIYASVLAHEYGHALTARKFGFRTQKILLMIFGGAAFIEGDWVDSRPKDSIKISLAGPAVSLALAIVFLLLAYGTASIFNLTVANPLIELFAWTMIINAILFVFNLLPITPLDGGRVYRAILIMKFGLRKATDVAYYTTVVLGTVLAIVSLAFSSLFTAAIAISLIFMAYQERKNTQIQSELF